LYLYNASGVQIRASTGTGGTEKISLADLAAGAYYVKAVNKYRVKTGTLYELTIDVSSVSSVRLDPESSDSSLEPPTNDDALFRSVFEDPSFEPFEEDETGL